MAMPGRAGLRVYLSVTQVAASLWDYGEDELAERVMSLTEDELSAIQRIAATYEDPTYPLPVEGQRITHNHVSALAAVAYLEGRLRPLSRTRRRPAKQRPARYAPRMPDPTLGLPPIPPSMRSPSPDVTGSGIRWPARWQPEAQIALVPYFGHEARVEIIVGSPTDMDGTPLGGFVYLDNDEPKIIHDHTGRKDVYPWGLLSGPVLRIYEVRPRQKRKVLFAHPDWSPRRGE